MNFRTLLAAAAGVATVAAAGSAFAASATANASATIVAPSTLAATRDLTFGQIAKPTSGTSTITVASSSSASATPSIDGGNAYVTTNGQAASAAFQLTGSANQAYTVDSTVLSFTNSAGNLANIAALTPVASAGSVGQLPANGVQVLYVGGKFDITPSTAVTTYNGTLVLNVTYQ